MNDVIETIWEEFLKIVALEAGSHVVQTWLKAVTLVQWDAYEKIVYLKAPNTFIKEWIKTNYSILFQIHLSRLLNVDKVRIVFLDNISLENKKESIPSPTVMIPAVMVTEKNSYQDKKFLPAKRAYEKIKSSINKNYTFDNFVVGPSNQLAYAASHAVTEKIGKLYNPLFIYGGSGLGKTHLLHAIGNEIKASNKKAEILYQTADHFVNEFINAIRFDKVTQFKEKYTRLDVLLIDDVQFISNKEQTQEAFFHIFNTLYESHKQIVFSSDSEPAGINGLAERLRSRFQWGLVADIQAPTTETKIAILKRKADGYQQELSDEVIHYIACHVISNIRELEGVLIRITAFAALTNQPITLDLVRKSLMRNQSNSKKTVIDFSAIVKVISKHYGYNLNELRSQVRDKQLSLVRQISMYFMKRLTSKSLQEIGSYLARKDHTTVMYGVQKIDNLLANDERFNRYLKNIEQEIKEKS